jgi:hypothetical protein
MVSLCPGEEADLPELYGSEGAGVDHGVPHQIYQGGQNYKFWVIFCSGS